MSKSKVYVLQEPTRFDAELNVRVPIVDLRPAASFGEIEVVMPNRVSAIFMAPIITTLKERLADFNEETDYLIALGDPALIAAAGGILLRRMKSFRLLRWDKRTRQYSAVEVAV